MNKSTSAMSSRRETIDSVNEVETQRPFSNSSTALNIWTSPHRSPRSSHQLHPPSLSPTAGSTTTTITPVHQPISINHQPLTTNPGNHNSTTIIPAATTVPPGTTTTTSMVRSPYNNPVNRSAVPVHQSSTNPYATRHPFLTGALPSNHNSTSIPLYEDPTKGLLVTFNPVRHKIEVSRVLSSMDEDEDNNVLLRCPLCGALGPRVSGTGNTIPGRRVVPTNVEENSYHDASSTPSTSSGLDNRGASVHVENLVDRRGGLTTRSGFSGGGAAIPFPHHQHQNRLTRGHTPIFDDNTTNNNSTVDSRLQPYNANATTNTTATRTANGQMNIFGAGSGGIGNTTSSSIMQHGGSGIFHSPFSGQSYFEFLLAFYEIGKTVLAAQGVDSSNNTSSRRSRSYTRSRSPTNDRRSFSEILPPSANDHEEFNSDTRIESVSGSVSPVRDSSNMNLEQNKSPTTSKINSEDQQETALTITTTTQQDIYLTPDELEDNDLDLISNNPFSPNPFTVPAAILDQNQEIPIQENSNQETEEKRDDHDMGTNISSSSNIISTKQSQNIKERMFIVESKLHYSGDRTQQDQMIEYNPAKITKTTQQDEEHQQKSQTEHQEQHITNQSIQSEDGTNPNINSTPLPCGVLNDGYYERFFIETDFLGRGGFGYCFRARHEIDGEILGEFAVKKVAVGDSRSWLRQVIKEVKFFERFHHPNIVMYNHSWLELWSPDERFSPKVPFLFILMQYCNGGHLQKLVESSGGLCQKGGLKEHMIFLILKDILMGLRYLHSQGMLHRDLKCENVLLHFEENFSTHQNKLYGGHQKFPRALLSDFGTTELKNSSQNNSLQEDNSSLSGIKKKKRRRLRDGWTGTIEYTAPELLIENNIGELSDSYDERSDMWSVGILTYNLVFGELPYKGINPHEIREKIVNSKNIPFPGEKNHDQKEKNDGKNEKNGTKIDVEKIDPIHELLASPKVGESKEETKARFRKLHAAKVEREQLATTAKSSAIKDGIDVPEEISNKDGHAQSFPSRYNIDEGKDKVDASSSIITEQNFEDFSINIRKRTSNTTSTEVVHSDEKLKEDTKNVSRKMEDPATSNKSNTITNIDNTNTMSLLPLVQSPRPSQLLSHQLSSSWAGQNESTHSESLPVPPLFRGLLAALLARDPNARPMAADILQNPAFTALARVSQTNKNRSLALGT